MVRHDWAMDKGKYARQLEEWAKRRQEMAQLIAQGWSYAKVARRYKRSRQRIAKMFAPPK